MFRESISSAPMVRLLLVVFLGGTITFRLLSGGAGAVDEEGSPAAVSVMPNCTRWKISRSVPGAMLRYSTGGGRDVQFSTFKIKRDDQFGWRQEGD